MSEIKKIIEKKTNAFKAFLYFVLFIFIYLLIKSRNSDL